MSLNKNKPLHVSVLFIRPSSGGPYAVLCAVTIMSSADLRSSAEDRIVTAQSTVYGPPEDGKMKGTETCSGLFVFTNMFLTF